MGAPKEMKSVFLLALCLITLAAFFVSLQNAEKNKAYWWDEVEYVSLADNMHDKGTYAFAYSDEIQSFRPPLLSVYISTFYYLLGNNELSVRIFVSVFSALSVAIAFLLGKKLFDEIAGIVASLLVFHSTLFIFYSARVLTEVPAIFFAAFSAYFLWEAFGEKKAYALPFFAISFSLGFLMKYTFAFFALPFGLLALVAILFKNRLPILLSKHLVFSAVAVLALVSPILIFSQNTFGSSVKIFSEQVGAVQNADNPNFYFENLGHILTSDSIVILIILGFLLAVLLFLMKDKSAFPALFLSVSVISFFLLLNYFIPHKEDRYLLPILVLALSLPAFFFSTLFRHSLSLATELWKSKGKIGETKAVGLAFSVFFLLFSIQGIYAGAFGNQESAKSLLDSKANTYAELKDAGEYINKMAGSGGYVMSDYILIAFYSKKFHTGLPSDAAGLVSEVEKKNVHFIATSIYGSGNTYISALQKASAGNLTSASNSIEYLLLNPDKYVLKKAVNGPEGFPYVMVFETNSS